MIFGGTSTPVLDSSPATVLYIEKSQRKRCKKVAEGSGNHGGMDGRKWVENKSR
jgi:hypothetical protein